MSFLKGSFTFNRIRQFAFIVEYTYLAFICILIIKRYEPSSTDFGLYLPLLLNISIALVYSIVLFYSGRSKEPSKFEIVMRLVYLFMVGHLLAKTQNPSVQIILVLPTVIVALRYQIKYTFITVFVTTIVILISQIWYHHFEIDYLFIFISFIWVIGLLVNATVEMERQIQAERQQFLEREKLAAIGQMAAGIAHEVRNPLTTIKGFVQLLYKYNAAKDWNTLKSYLDTIDNEIDRMNSLLKNFLHFAKPGKPKMAMWNINETILDIALLLEAHSTSKRIKTEIILASDMPDTLYDYDQIKQVVINIALNAIDAMVNSDTKLLKIRTSYNNYNVRIHIEDTGIGMTEEEKRNIFVPFYTTKESGTGLGLSVCYTVIENHQGKIEVQSELHKGTVFTIFIPRNQ